MYFVSNNPVKKIKLSKEEFQYEEIITVLLSIAAVEFHRGQQQIR